MRLKVNNCVFLKIKSQCGILLLLSCTSFLLYITLYHNRQSQNRNVNIFLPSTSVSTSNTFHTQENHGGRRENEVQSGNRTGELFSNKYYLWRGDTKEKKGNSNKNEIKNQSLTKNVEEYYLDDRIVKQLYWIEKISGTSFVQNLKPKKILVLDGFYSYYGVDGSLTCPGSGSGTGIESKCSLVQDNWYTGIFKDLEGFDAIVGIRNWVYKIYEGKLPRHLRQILFTVESPYVTKYADFSVNNAILASYFRGSDITVPYGKWISYDQLSRITENSTNVSFSDKKTVDKSKTEFNSHSTNNVKNQSDSPVGIDNKSHFSTVQDNQRKNEIFRSSRKKLAAIVVSDCSPENNRLKYVEELQKYIPVDIYGRCGDLKCGADCFSRLREEYKFYLAFENANCRDYITEKFFQNALEYDLVPVVLGAHKTDYIYASPPHSFIHVEDFVTPKDLANYLLFLHQNETAYNKYFEWQNKGQFLDHWKYFFCRVCALLHYGDFVQSPVWPKGSTWKKLNKCLPPGRWYWEREN